jgi:hypothetical protein
MILAVVIFFPLMFLTSDSTPRSLIRLLGGIGIVISGVLFAVADRFGLLKSGHDLVELFPQAPEPPPPLSALPAIVAQEVATSLPELPGHLAEALEEHAQENLPSPTDLL